MSSPIIPPSFFTIRRPRNSSVSTLPIPSPPNSETPLSRVASNPLPDPSTPLPSSKSTSASSPSPPRPSSLTATPSTISSPLPPPAPRTRSHSRSPSRPSSPPKGALQQDVETGKSSPASTSWWWWQRSDFSSRPWKDSMSTKEGTSHPVVKRKPTLPEHTEGWAHARERVALAAVSVLGTTADIAHDVLLNSVDLLHFAPVPGLGEAARVLLSVWDALQKVDSNRMACIRLTERCADILVSVREEVYEAGDEVTEELKEPIRKLTDAFTQVHVFLQKQINRPFLHRYLKRDDILGEIQERDADLHNALGMFSMSIQIRTLKQVQRGEIKRQADTQDLLRAVQRILPSTAQATPTQIDEALRVVRTRQNEFDAARDAADLRMLMRGAVQAGDDTNMIDVLQVEREEMPEAIKTLQRALERLSLGSAVGTVDADGKPVPAGQQPRKGTLASLESQRGAGKFGGSDVDTLDKEFLESGIDALTRISLSKGVRVEDLPSWTITRYEVDREEKIGFGFFADVFRGVWRQRVVAIKVLARSTPRSLFIHEAAIWKTLKHPNVLELYGASSASREGPWFFVCKFCRGGNLVKYLKSVEEEVWRTSVGVALGKGVDLLKMMGEVARGMQYLHSNGVLHGDLKASNVLVDILERQTRCVVSDFGQSEMKSEVYRLSGTPLPHGTLRWQAPEVLSGRKQQLTVEVDVYAFGILCSEILNKGGLPWPALDDDAVRHLVLEDNSRPVLPNLRISTPALLELIHATWDRGPFKRPKFGHIASELKRIRLLVSGNADESPSPRLIDILEEEPVQPSPDMHPVPLPVNGDDVVVEEIVDGHISTSPTTSESYRTAEGGSDNLPDAPAGPATIDSPVLPLDNVENAEESFTSQPVTFTRISPISRSSTEEGEEGEQFGDPESWLDFEGYESPVPVDSTVAELRNERRYRLLLAHDFHPSLTLPLWTPAPVALGTVGYLSKPDGRFVSLFNMFDPSKTSDGLLKSLPSVYGYGRVTQGSLRQDKRNVAQRGLDAISGFLTLKGKNGSIPVRRWYSFPLRSGHKTAHLCAETTIYRYVENLDAPKKWFKANVDVIMHTYGAAHRLRKENLFLVIGTLDAPDYALFVSHNHPNGQAHFNIYSSQKAGQAWGMFTTDTEHPNVVGPDYDEGIPGTPVSASKVSRVGRQGSWDTLLLARLRFKPDVPEPTAL